MLGAILGSAFADEPPAGLTFEPLEVQTEFGDWRLQRVEGIDRPAVVSFRHGRPHRLLPNQIPYRAQIRALQKVGCTSLLVTSSVGVLVEELPLFEPLVVGDLATLDNRMPDGSACTMFPTPTDGQGHLVLEEGLFDSRLTAQLQRLAEDRDLAVGGPVDFGYVGGPRGKTPAENRMWAALGAEVNSMTLAPEVILANELEIPCAGLVVGHKYSVADATGMADGPTVTASLAEARDASGRLIAAFLQRGSPVEFGNQIYRFE